MKRLGPWLAKRVAFGLGLLGLIVFLGWIAGPDPRTTPADTQGLRRGMSPGDVREFVRWADALRDRLPDDRVEITDDHVLMWELEFVPFFEYERFTSSVTYAPVEFQPMDGAERHNGILGFASCGAGEVVLNARFVNPHSPWYGDQGYLGTLVHELAHVNGACGHGPIDETVAQLVSVEVMASMANNGNPEVVGPLLAELVDWGLGYLRSEAYDHAINVDGYGLTTTQSEALQRYWAFHNEVAPEHFTAVKQRARNRAPEENLRIAFLYRHEPLRLLANSLVRGGEIPNLPLPPFFEAARFGLPTSNLRAFLMNDTLYFLNHAEEIVEAAR